MRSLKSHQSASMKSDVWLTPQYILKPLGKFDLDPCTTPDHPWQVAEKFFTKEDDGLKQEWFGRVWMNPPFGNNKWDWMRKLADHGNGIALIPGCTETKGFYETVWNRADAICFLKGRPHFHLPCGTRGRANSGAPIVLVAYGSENRVILGAAGLGVTLDISEVSLPFGK